MVDHFGLDKSRRGAAGYAMMLPFLKSGKGLKLCGLFISTPNTAFLGLELMTDY